MALRRLAIVCLAALLPGIAIADPEAEKKTWTVSQFPNPNQDISACGRGVKSWICDPDHVLSKGGADLTEGVIKLIASGQPPYGMLPCGNDGYTGYEVAVAIMRKMYVPDGLDDAGAAERFAQTLHGQWGVGRADCQNGVLLLLAMENRQLYISIGDGTKNRLTSLQLDHIIANAGAKLKRADGTVDAAVQEAVVNIGLALSGRDIDAPATGGWTGFFVVFGVFGGVIGIIVCQGRRDWRERMRYRDCRALLERIKRDQAALQTGSYSVSSCPICLEEFEAEGADQAGSSAGPSAAGPSNSEDAPLLGSQTAGGGSSSSAATPASPRAAAAAAAAARAGNRAAAAAAATAMGAAAGAAGAAAAAPFPPRRALVVGCGHVFCEPCLEKWVAQQRKVSCPICRRDVETGSDAPPPPPPFNRPCNEQMNMWDQDFPDAVLPGVQPNLRLRLDPTWQRSRVGTWRYRGANGYGYNDWQRHYGGGLTQDQIVDMQRNELLFRIMALRRRYPEYVNSDMAHTWGDDIYAGRVLSVRQLRDFQLRDPAIKRELERQGASGSSSSFGGGGGGGHSGGGRGGGW